MKLACFALFLFILNYSWSQNDLKEGKQHSLVGLNKISEILGIDNDLIYFSLEDKEKHISGIGVISLDGSYYKTMSINKVFSKDFFAYTHQGKLLVYLTIESGDKLNLTLSAFDKTLSSTEQAVILSHVRSSVRSKGRFKLAISPDKNNIGVLQEAPQSRGESEILQCHLLSKDGLIKWTKSLNTKISQVTKPSNQVIVSNSGQIHVLKRTRTEVTYNFILYSFDELLPSHGQNVVLRGAKIAEIVFGSNDQGKVMVAGLYSKEKFDHSDGYFYFLYNTNGNMLMETSKAFPQQMLDTYQGSSKGNKKGPSLVDVYLQEIIASGNNFTLLFEYDVLIASKAKNSNTYDRQYVKGNITTAIINNNGDVENWIKIDKNQNSWRDNAFFSSFIVTSSIESISLFFNNISSNNKTKTVIEPFDNVTLFKFDLADYKKPPMRLSLNSSKYISPKLILIEKERVIGVSCNLLRSEIQPFIINIQQ